MRLFTLTHATAIACAAQSLSLSGIVTDQKSAAISAVTVTLTGSAGGRKVATTDTAGKYQFTGLSAGTYYLVFDRASFESVSRNGEMTANTEVSVTLPVEGEVISIDVVDVAGKATTSRLEIPDSDIPVQVSSISEQLLEQQGVNDMVTALRNASGVQAQRFYGEYYTIRGFNSPRFTQKHAANLWLNKMWKSGFTASIGMRYLGPMFTDNENTTRIGGWTTFSGAAGYRHNKWEFTVNAENLFNRNRYFTGSDYTDQVYPGAPINGFATVRVHFN